MPYVPQGFLCRGTDRVRCHPGRYPYHLVYLVYAADDQMVGPIAQPADCAAICMHANIRDDGYMLLTIPLLLYSTYNYDGCLGGFPLTGYGYVARIGGLTTEALYPYDVMTSFCDASKTNYAVTVTMSYRVEGEQNMINQVLAGRTLSVAVDSNQWGPYKSGIFSGCSVNYQVNHAVNIVGVNVLEGYWIIRNSWGSWWGDNGYMKLALVRGCSRCVLFV